MVETHGIGAVNLTFICNWSKTLKHSEVLEIEIVVCDVIQWDTRRAFSRKNTNWVRSHLFFVQPTAPHPFLWGANKEIVILIGKKFPKKFQNFPTFFILGSGQWEDGQILGRVQISTDFQSVPCSLLFLSLSLSLEREWWIFYNSLFPRAAIQDRFVWNMPIYLNNIKI